MDLDQLCVSCFKERGASQICQHCGYEESREIESHAYLAPRTILEEKYLIGRVLGQGGFGITYLAWDLNLNIKLAIKEYFPSDLATRVPGQSQVSAYNRSLGTQYEYGLDKFLQEARTLAQFEEHPNIVSVRDFFQANNTAYLVMKYVEGITLKEHMAHAGGKLPVEEAKKIIMPIMDALIEVHEVDVLHRDISPDNIFINQSGRVILIDFGAARQAISDKGRSLSVILKPGYAPVEQYRTKGDQGPWTDVYALAATFYHLITGRQPPEALERLDDDSLTPPKEFGAELSTNEEKALIKALAVRAKDRFQSMKEFQNALLGQMLDESRTIKKKKALPALKNKTFFYPLAAAVFLIVLFGGLYFSGLISRDSSSALYADLPEGALIVVTSAEDRGNGTLRRAIETARRGDVIIFDQKVFPPKDPTTIHLKSALPPLFRGNLTIDASNAGVIIDGSEAEDDHYLAGLRITSSDNVIMGLQILNCLSYDFFHDVPSGACIEITDRTAANNVIGGDRSIGEGPVGQGNLLSGSEYGIDIHGLASDNIVTGNLIGTDLSGKGPNENGPNTHGIIVGEGANGNIIGPDNVIAYNASGVTIGEPYDHEYWQEGTANNTVTANSIYNNGFYVIGGANNSIYPPVLTGVDLEKGTVRGTACPGCTVEIFSDSHNQGEIYEGSTVADSDGSFTFSAGRPLEGPSITATATDPDGNTSEFSRPVSR